MKGINLETAAIILSKIGKKGVKVSEASALIRNKLLELIKKHPQVLASN